MLLFFPIVNPISRLLHCKDATIPFANISVFIFLRYDLTSVAIRYDLQYRFGTVFENDSVHVQAKNMHLIQHGGFI